MEYPPATNGLSVTAITWQAPNYAAKLSQVPDVVSDAAVHRWGNTQALCIAVQLYHLREVGLSCEDFRDSIAIVHKAIKAIKSHQW